MHENDFETIINKWRRLAVLERVDQKELASMSGDSSSQQTFSKKKEDESNLILPEPSGTIPVAIGAGAGAVAVAELAPDNDGKTSEETQDLIKHDSNESKEAAGDTCDKDQKSDKDFSENSEVYDTMKGTLCKVGDNVDSVFLRSPPPHKTRSNVSTPNSEDEDCCIKCLYYTIQCCDCAIM